MQSFFKTSLLVVFAAAQTQDSRYLNKVNDLKAKIKPTLLECVDRVSFQSRDDTYKLNTCARNTINTLSAYG